MQVKQIHIESVDVANDRYTYRLRQTGYSPAKQGWARYEESKQPDAKNHQQGQSFATPLFGICQRLCHCEIPK